MPAAQSFLHNGVTAHRGNAADYPQNTLPAFRSAIEMGADWMELDVRLTRDGKLAVIHDADTQYVAGVRVVVAASTYDQLKAIDVAARFRKAHHLTIEQCPKATIPLLADVLRLVTAQHHTRVSIQPKADCVPAIIALINEMDAAPWVGFNDGSLPWMSQAKQLAPQIPIFWDRHRSDITADIATATQRGFESIVMHYKDVTPEKVAAIRAAGIEAGAWTVNDIPTMKRLLAIGIQRFYTDHPARLFEVKKAIAAQGQAR